MLAIPAVAAALAPAAAAVDPPVAAAAPVVEATEDPAVAVEEADSLLGIELLLLIIRLTKASGVTVLAIVSELVHLMDLPKLRFVQVSS